MKPNCMQVMFSVETNIISKKFYGTHLSHKLAFNEVVYMETLYQNFAMSMYIIKQRELSISIFKKSAYC